MEEIMILLLKILHLFFYYELEYCSLFECEIGEPKSKFSSNDESEIEQEVLF